MVWSLLEQKYLMEMLRARNFDDKIRLARTAYFYRTMKLLEKNRCIVIDTDSTQEFIITSWGELLAHIVIKHSETDKIYKKHDRVVEWFLW